jgi:hypothetical protein
LFPGTEKNPYKTHGEFIDCLLRHSKQKVISTVRHRYAKLDTSFVEM